MTQQPFADPRPELDASCGVRARADAGQVPADSPRIASRELLGGQNCVTIDHEGVSYVLRATRAGKLILTK